MVTIGGGAVALSAPATAHGPGAAASGVPAWSVAIVSAAASVAVGLVGVLTRTGPCDAEAGRLRSAGRRHLPTVPTGLVPALTGLFGVATLGAAARSASASVPAPVPFAGSSPGWALVVAGGVVGLVALPTATRLAGGHPADVAVGAVTLHRGVEGTALATLLAVDAAVGLSAAVLVTVHAAGETVAACGLYRRRLRAAAAVGLVQAGFLGDPPSGPRRVDGRPLDAGSGSGSRPRGRLAIRDS